MDPRRLLLIVGALVVAAVTAFLARSLVVGTPAPTAVAVPVLGPPAPPANTTEVLVARRALPVGTILDASTVEFRPWPKELVAGAYLLRGQTDVSRLQGTVVRFAIPAGQPVPQGALVQPGDRGFLAAALGPGMRAITVPVSAQSAVAGFVFPGDRVDLILTQTVDGGGDGPPLRASETVLRNLRVLATDQRTDKQTDGRGNTVVNGYSTVTLEATPRIAEKIAVAQTVGALSLSLRSIADAPDDLEEAIASGAIEVPDDPRQEKAMLARRTARPQEGGETFVTGADVSRFQRSTVPGRSEAAPSLSATAAPAPAAGSAAAVRVVRGNDSSLVPVGGKN